MLLDGSDATDLAGRSQELPRYDTFSINIGSACGLPNVPVL